MKKVLVTGISGFIGSQAIQFLKEKKYEIHGVYCSNRPSYDEDIHMHPVNLLDQTSVESLLATVKPTHLLHLAWFAQPGKYWTDTKNLEWVRASLFLYRMFHEHGGKRAVMAGTCAEYDLNAGLCNEKSTPLQPNTLYGTCKNSLYQIVESYSKLHCLSYAWCRIFFLYGPNEYSSRLVPSVIKSLLNSEEARCSHGEQIRDFLHVHDVAHAFVTILDCDIKGSINIGSGEGKTLKTLINAIGTKLNASHLIKLGSIKSPPEEPAIIVADTTRLECELNWKPKYSLESGLDQVIAWWQEKRESLI